MKLQDAAEMIQNLMAEHGLLEHGWTWRWGKGVKVMGHCQYAIREIVLYKPYTLAQDDISDVRNTILHEIAHALAGQSAGHGHTWKRIARLIGCDAERTGVNPAYSSHIAEKNGRTSTVAAALTPAEAVRMQALRPGDIVRVELPSNKYHDVVGQVLTVTSKKVHITMPRNRKLMVPKEHIRPA